MSEHIIPDVMDQISDEMMLVSLGCGFDRNDGKLSSFPTHRRFPKSAKEGRTKAVCKYLNKISDFVKTRETITTQWSIHFLPTQDNAPLSHPTLTQCRPDMAVVRKLPEQLLDSKELYWSQLEATGEGESSKKRKDEAHAQGAAYTGYLLLARPDYISVPGIFFNTTHFKLFLTNACRVYTTDIMPWGSPIARRLLYTWFWLLYHPEVDDTIKICHESSKAPTFTVETEPGTFYEGCSILSTGRPFGRRTTVFAPTTIRGTATDATDRVIKEQYIEIGHRFEEGPILKRIHSDNSAVFPGVVRVGWHGTVKSDNGVVELKEDGVVKRVKRRLELLDKAEPLARVQTPREFLMAIYDLLEITRVLWRKFKILHRDISPNNVLLRDEPVIPDGPLPSDLGDICFSGYLLSKTSPSLPHPPENTEVPASTLLQAQALPPLSHLPAQIETDFDSARLSTRLVSIDYDMSEDQTPVLSGTEPPKDQTGTDVFIARVVRAGEIWDGEHVFNPMPQLDVARDIYELQYPDRLQRFPLDEHIFHKKLNSFPLSPFQHQLRYDAESVFWLFVWWSLQIRPAGSTSEDLLPTECWNDLTSERDRRYGFIYPNFPKSVLHPDYRPLEALLKQMASQLKGDHSLIQSRQHPEYLHEAFQRLILEFLFVNYDEEFMDLETHDEFRKVKVPIGVSQSSYTSTGKRKREEGGAGAKQRKRPKLFK